MLGIDKGYDSTKSLGFSQNLERQGRLAGGLGAINLDDAATRDATDTQSVVERDGSGWDGLNLIVGASITELHDGALAKTLLDLGGGFLDDLLSVLALSTGPNAFAERSLCLSHVNSLVVDRPDTNRTAVLGQRTRTKIPPASFGKLTVCCRVSCRTLSQIYANLLFAGN